MFIRPAANIKLFAPIEHEGFEYIAVIQNGMQIGALALTPDGAYVQVNGDVVQPLNEYKVLRALRKKLPYRDWSIKPTRPGAPPVVSVRRRRRVPTEAARG